MNRVQVILPFDNVATYDWFRQPRIVINPEIINWIRDNSKLKLTQFEYYLNQDL